VDIQTHFDHEARPTSRTHEHALSRLNVLLSFAQFEREVIGERIRDKIAAAKKKMWMGGVPPLGYRVEDRKLVVVDHEAQIVRSIFTRRPARAGLRCKNWRTAITSQH
jgi:DNA invertase Pin-like site-specific DNA recombinase